MSTSKSCTNCPGATDHDTAHCPLRVIRLGDLNPEQRLALARGHRPEQADDPSGDSGVVIVREVLLAAEPQLVKGE